MIEYVIFDMDGTLLDTEPLYQRSWIETGEKWGLSGMSEMYLRLICGRSVESSKKVLRDHFGEDFDAESFLKERMDLYHHYTKYEVCPCSFADEWDYSDHPHQA